MGEGIADELRGIHFGDQRLNKRSRCVIEALAANPEANINAACQNWGDTLAAYRFFDNGVVLPEQILQPHFQATQRRMREHSVVFAVQDTTELDFTDPPPKDARCLNTEQRFGSAAADHSNRQFDAIAIKPVSSWQMRLRTRDLAMRTAATTRRADGNDEGSFHRQPQTWVSMWSRRRFRHDVRLRLAVSQRGGSSTRQFYLPLVPNGRGKPDHGVKIGISPSCRLRMLKRDVGVTSHSGNRMLRGGQQRGVAF